MKENESQILDLKGILLALERELLSPQNRSSTEQMERLLAQEFVEFGSSGRIYDKQSIMHALTQSDVADNFQVEDFKVVTERDDMALVSYRCKALSAASEVIRTSNRSSLWKLLDGHWQLVFHQGTRTE